MSKYPATRFRLDAADATGNRLAWTLAKLVIAALLAVALATLITGCGGASITLDSEGNLLIEGQMYVPPGSVTAAPTPETDTVEAYEPETDVEIEALAVALAQSVVADLTDIATSVGSVRPPAEDAQHLLRLLVRIVDQRRADRAESASDAEAAEQFQPIIDRAAAALDSLPTDG